MADWYVSSATNAAVAVWATAIAYTVGQFVRPTAPATGREYVFRCTVAGTSSGAEPSWPTGNNATVASGGATFANVTGQSTYGWSAAAGKVYTISNAVSTRAVVGDRVFVSSDHSESVSSTYAFGTAGFGVIQFISINRAGSVPPVAADVTPGATISNPAGNLTINNITDLYWEGITLSCATGSTTGNIVFANSDYKSQYLKNCAVSLPNTTAARILLNTAAEITFDNTTVQFGATTQAIASATASLSLNWLNTPSAIAGATFPASLFLASSSTTSLHVTCRGVDLSAITGNLFDPPAFVGWCKALLDSCKISSSATKLSTAGSNAADQVELVNCHDGTNVLNERYTRAGAVTTDRGTTMSGGAQDDVGNYSLKLVSSSNADKYAMPLDAFWFDVENAATGSSKTATVEILSSGSLNNDEISLLLEYMGTSGNSQASFASSMPVSRVTAASALPSSAVTWTAAAVANSYSNSGGSGNRTASITVTTTATLGVGSIGQIVNGSQANECWLNSGQSGREIKFDFGTARNITEAPWYPDTTGTHGTWKWQGSNNDSSYTDIGSTFTLGGTAQVITTLSGNASTWRYYKLLQTAGTTNSGPFVREVEFKIDGTPPSTKQQLQATFTPQRAGRVRGLVRLGISTTVWVNPQITVT